MPVSRHRRRRSGAAARNRGAAVALARPKKQKPSYLYIGASALIAVLVIAGFALGGGGFGHSGLGRTGSDEGYVDGIGAQQDVMPTRDHIPESQTVDYNTVPSTSGNHWAQWSTCDFFEYPLSDERVTHNLEHGIIVVSYNLATPEEVAELRDAIDDIGLANVWGLARAYDKIPVGTVAIAAWGILDTMEGVDPDRLEQFFKAYAGTQGPERIICGNSGVTDPPPEDLQ